MCASSVTSMARTTRLSSIPGVTFVYADVFSIPTFVGSRIDLRRWSGEPGRHYRRFRAR
jgi:hypothetical protein